MSAIAADLAALQMRAPGLVSPEAWNHLLKTIAKLEVVQVLGGSGDVGIGGTVIKVGAAGPRVPPLAVGLLQVYYIDSTHIGVTAGNVTFFNTVTFPGCYAGGTGDSAPQEITDAQSVWLQINYTDDGDGNANGIDSLQLQIVDTGTSPGTNDATVYYLLLADVAWDAMNSVIIPSSLDVTSFLCTVYVRNNCALAVCGPDSTPLFAP